jgi:hypothetical protein
MSQVELRLLAKAKQVNHVMEIDMSESFGNFPTRKNNVFEVFWNITQYQSLDDALIEFQFDQNVRNCQPFNNEI